MSFSLYIKTDSIFCQLIHFVPDVILLQNKFNKCMWNYWRNDYM